MRRHRLHRHDQGGAAMAEFAIVGVVLFMLFFAVIDMGLIEIGNSASGNAAREGARIGALYPVKADVPGQPSNTAVINAVKAKMGGLIKNITVVVTCLGPDNVTVVLCQNATAERDLIKVAVTYTSRGVSPFVKTGTHTESATVLVVGSAAYAAAPATTLPSGTTTTIAPTTCTIQTSSVTPSSVTVSGAEPNVLTGPVAITVTTTGTCSYMFVTFYPEGDPAVPATAPDPVTIFLTQTGPTFTHTIAANDYATWRTSQLTFTFHDFFGVIAGADVVLHVSSPGVCSVVAASVSPPTNSPPSVVLSSTTQPTTLATGETVLVNMTSTAACANVYISFTPGAAASSVSALMTKLGTVYTFPITAAQYATWTAGLKVFSFTNGAAPTPLAYQGPTASFQVNIPAPACNVSVSFKNALGLPITSINVTKAGNAADLVTPFNVTVTPTGTCSLPIYTRYDRGNGFSGTVGQAAMTGNTFALAANEGGTKAWAQGGLVTFRFYNGVPGPSNQLTPLSPTTLILVLT